MIIVSHPSKRYRVSVMANMSSCPRKYCCITLEITPESYARGGTEEILRAMSCFVLVGVIARPNLDD